jgi:ribose transport system substrate-binding protein
LILASLVGACSSEEDAGERTVVRIGWLAKGAQNTFFDLSRSAAQLAASDLSSASGKDVRVELLDADEPTADAQLERVNAAIESGVDALAISVLDPVILTPAIDKANDAGIPVITFDSDAPDSKRRTFYGIDNRAGAEQAAELLAGLMGKQGKVAIMTAEGVTPGTLSTSQTYLERMEGFEEAIAAHPDIEVVEVIPCGKTAEAEKAGCTKILEEVLEAHPDLGGWYLARGRVLREAELETLAPNFADAVKNGNLKVVGFDAPEDALHSVESGLVHALITQDYFGWGYDVVNLAFDVATYDRELEPFTDSQFEVICGNNISELRGMWDAQDFRSALEPCDLLK